MPRAGPAFRPIAGLLLCVHCGHQEKLAVISIDGGQPVKLFDVPKTANFRYGIRWLPDAQALAYRDWF
jgi:hypothetical protein